MATPQSAILVLLFLSWTSVATAIATAAPGDRIITIVNMCNQNISVGHTGAECIPADFTLYNETGCPEGQTLNRNNWQCYWDIPQPEHGRSLDLEPNSSISLRLTAPEQTCQPLNKRVKWSGNIWGATGCDERGVCETAICNNGHCPTYEGPVGPVTLAEFTLQNEESDFYDVSIIDGVNIPVEVKPSITNTTKSAKEANQMGVAAYYWCSNPGGVVASNRNLSDCTWDFQIAPFEVSGFEANSTLLALVANNATGNKNCSKNFHCTDGEVCGTLEELSMSGGPGQNVFPGKCGKLIGLWNANAICTWAAGVNESSRFPNTDPFRCRRYTGQNDANDTFAHLYGCAGLYSTSGYKVNSSTVCGCPTWKDKGIKAPPIDPCRGNNTVWERNALPWVEWMKRACPTSYVFPFDDESSSFQCQNKDPTFNNRNTQGYTITFCPGSKEILIVPETLTSSSRKAVDLNVPIIIVTLAAMLAVMH